MEVYRLSISKHAGKKTASGRSGRWNLDNEFVIYTGASRSLATLELVVRRSSIKPAVNYKITVFTLPDEKEFYNIIEKSNLGPDWREISGYSNLQALGSSWYRKQEAMILRVPSAVIPEENNYVINTAHADIKKVRIVGVEDYFWDSRLLGDQNS